MAPDQPTTDETTDQSDPCPNCGHGLHKTGNPTSGNSPEKKCAACGWLNHRGRPARTGPPYDSEAED